jgi:hypothetical protein
VKRSAFVGFLCLVLGVPGTYFWMSNMSKTTTPPVRLKEPLLILTDQEHNRYLLPAGTVLQHVQGFDEGHQLYTVDVLFKGRFEAEQIKPGERYEKMWVETIDDREQVQKLINNYPLTKNDLVKILKARKMTRDDLAQIVREWTD